MFGRSSSDGNDRSFLLADRDDIVDYGIQSDGEAYSHPLGDAYNISHTSIDDFNANFGESLRTMSHKILTGKIKDFFVAYLKTILTFELLY